MEVEMKIRGLMMDPVTNMPIVVLKDVQGQAILPIWVGVYEANAIALEMEKVSTPRPMTHDLMNEMLEKLDVSCSKVSVTELRENTFFASITLSVAGRERRSSSSSRARAPLSTPPPSTTPASPGSRGWPSPSRTAPQADAGTRPMAVRSRAASSQPME